MERKDLKRELVADLAITAALVAFVLIFSPGLAAVGIVALLVLFVVGAGAALSLVRRGRGPRSSHQETSWSAGANGHAQRRSRLS